MTTIKKAIRQIKRICKYTKVSYDTFSRHTSFKIGGYTYFVEPNSLGDIIKIVNICNVFDTKYIVIGNGTNILASDDGFCGIVIRLTKTFCNIEKEYCRLLCGAGVSLMRVCQFAKDNGLSGLECLYGIPGSVGGAIYMNAGAYGVSMSQVTYGVLYLKGGKVYYEKNDKLNLSYRHSIFMEQKDIIILRVDIDLIPQSSVLIEKKMNEILCERHKKQPYEYPSAGSVFKRIDSMPVSKVIDECGLKGTQIGGACVSQKHAGFIVNTNHATCKDVKLLIKYIQEIVYSKYGIQLECEIIMIE